MEEIIIKYKKRIIEKMGENEIYLNFSNKHINEIKQIEGLDKLVNLKRLELGWNKINKIEGLDNLIKKLPKLKGIYLNHNKINEKSWKEIEQIQKNHPEIYIEF